MRTRFRCNAPALREKQQEEERLARIAFEEAKEKRRLARVAALRGKTL
jgi:hypothetical protein